MAFSLFYLLALYYTKHIPQTVFWKLYLLPPNQSRPRTVRIAFLVILSQLLAWLLIVLHLVFLLNVLLINNFHTTVLPILLTQKLKDQYYSFLLSPLVCEKKINLAAKLVFRLLEFFALISIGIGLVDLVNDLTSHANPDLFDFLFPFSGALPFFGGIVLLSFTSFFLYFIFPLKNPQQWQKRYQISLGFPHCLRNYTVPPSLLHPYFFNRPER